MNMMKNCFQLSGNLLQLSFFSKTRTSLNSFFCTQNWGSNKGTAILDLILINKLEVTRKKKKMTIEQRSPIITIKNIFFGGGGNKTIIAKTLNSHTSKWWVVYSQLLEGKLKFREKRQTGPMVRSWFNNMDWAHTIC